VAACLLVAALPRVGWLALVLVATASLALQSRPGGALVILIAGLVPALVMPRAGMQWPLPVAAPALSVLSMAGAWPALAARGRTAWRRAALGVTGWIWILVAAPIANGDLYVRRFPGTPPADSWMRSLPKTADHVLGPLFSTGVIAGALVWGASALCLPLIRSRRSWALDLVLVTVWSAITASTTAALLRAADGTAPGVVVLGAMGGAVIALTPTLSRSWARAHE
jgi:hypothetical protein